MTTYRICLEVEKVWPFFWVIPFFSFQGFFYVQKHEKGEIEMDVYDNDWIKIDEVV
ncbi:hypothetical protein PAECIP111894_04231 [Paenibacillus pseudetheri]|uniref:Uncharacterized protein n=1 Tax=Paenibacillus pseudetheri TaxID=2897682 RepID=A0ABN8FJ03_9BACL|nr:hypothetical protein PAECIP111894_04231 [Paenibacillus pseudetheri]